jgi:hypothetical protein
VKAHAETGGDARARDRHDERIGHALFVHALCVKELPLPTPAQQLGARFAVVFDAGVEQIAHLHLPARGAV